MRALVVDDALAVRKLLGPLLQAMGWEVAEAENGQEAINAVNDQGPFDLMLVDWLMPVMSGIDFIRLYQDQHNEEETTIVMVTTESDMERMDEAFELGVTEFLTKPFDVETFKDLLDRLFGE